MTETDQQALYDNTVIRLIQESGTEVILKSETQGEFDPVNGFETGTVTETQGYGIETESSFETVPETIAEKVVKTIMAIEIDHPKQEQDIITMRGIDYKVLYVETTQPGNVLFFYTIYLGK